MKFTPEFCVCACVRALYTLRHFLLEKYYPTNFLLEPFCRFHPILFSWNVLVSVLSFFFFVENFISIFIFCFFLIPSGLRIGDLLWAWDECRAFRRGCPIDLRFPVDLIITSRTKTTSTTATAPPNNYTSKNCAICTNKAYEMRKKEINRRGWLWPVPRLYLERDTNNETIPVAFNLFLTVHGSMQMCASTFQSNPSILRV